MSVDGLANLIFAAGIAQLGILTASALVPFQLDWRTTFRSLPRLHRQLYWVYGGYIVLSIIAFALLSMWHADELARGSGLTRGFCFYVAVFWGIRLSLQAVLDVKEHLTTWWLRLGYHGLTILFACFTLLYGGVACGFLRPP